MSEETKKSFLDNEAPEKWRLPSGDARVAFYLELTNGGIGGIEHQMRIHKLIRHVYYTERSCAEAEKRHELAETTWEFESRNLTDQIWKLRSEISSAILRIDTLENRPFLNVGNWLKRTLRSMRHKS